jgi:hypothetical protein
MPFHAHWDRTNMPFHAHWDRTNMSFHAYWGGANLSFYAAREALRNIAICGWVDCDES